MPLFSIKERNLSPVEQTNFANEKELQTLVELNLKPLFNCRLVATEFSTGAQHAGRIDTLALSEESNPVIIEYKKIESSELINQSLFYLHWIHDHRGDFEIAARKALGDKVQVDWSDVRVICIAPNYKKYDVHAVQVMGANIELWQYRLFKNGSLYLEEVFRKTVGTSDNSETASKNPVMVAAGKKAALTRATGSYSFEEHLEGVTPAIRNIAQSVQEFIMGLDQSFLEVPKKLYVAYKISQNIVCMEVRKSDILLYLKINPKTVSPLPPIARDVSEIGHYGTGDLELTLEKIEDLEVAKTIIAQAYSGIGG